MQIFSSFEEFIRKTFDPALTFLILMIVCILLDIAVRKFKFKWPHELIRERKERRLHEEGGSHDRS